MTVRAFTREPPPMQEPAPPMPPHSVEAEQSVLGSLLLDNDALARVAGIIGEPDFYRADHRAIWKAAAGLIEAGAAADVITVAERLEAAGKLEETGGLGYLAALAQNTPSAANAGHYAGIVGEKAKLRRAIESGHKFTDAANAGLPLDELAAEVLKAAEQLSGNSKRARLWPDPIDLAALAAREPAQPGFIIADWLPAGYATLLAGHGGIGKSGIALHLAVCLAAGLPFFGIPVQRRRTLYLSCEDRENVLHWRLARICEHLGIDLASLADWLQIHDLVGQQTVLWQPKPAGNGTTDAHAELARRIQRSGAQVLFVDGISDTFGGNENARHEVKAFVNAMLALIPPADGAVVLLGHIGKPAATGGASSEGYAGSTGWHNSVRARWYLYPETKRDDDDDRLQKTGSLVLELQKSNLGPTDRSIRFTWDEEAKLFAGSEVEAESSFDRKHRDRLERDGILAALKASVEPVPAASSGQRTAFHVLSVRADFPASLLSGKSGRTRFWKHVETLRSMGAIQEATIRRTNRHSSTVLVASSQTDGGCANASND